MKTFKNLIALFALLIVSTIFISKTKAAPYPGQAKIVWGGCCDGLLSCPGAGNCFNGGISSGDQIYIYGYNLIAWICSPVTLDNPDTDDNEGVYEITTNQQ